MYGTASPLLDGRQQRSEGLLATLCNGAEAKSTTLSLIKQIKMSNLEFSVLSCS